MILAPGRQGRHWRWRRKQSFTQIDAKERGKIEFEYAKNLRALVKKFTPKEPVQVPEKKPEKTGQLGSGPVSILSLNAPAEEEYSHLKAFKQV